MPRIVLLILAFYSISLAQGAEYSFEAITSKDGLSQNDVLDIYQDSRGFMWFSTIDGLNRYDGYDFRIFQVALDNSNSVSSNLIKAVTEDHDNNLWIGTLEQGLCVFNLITEEFTMIQNSPKNPSVLTDNGTYAMFCDSRNRIWHATSAGLNCITRNANGTLTIQKITSDPSNPKSISDNIINQVYEDTQKRIWVCTSLGLDLMIDSEKGKVQNQFINYTHHSGQVDIANILETPHGYLFSHRYGVDLLQLAPDSLEKTTITNIDQIPSWQLTRDSKNNIWVGSHNGLFLLSYTPNNFPFYSLTHHFTPGKEEKTLNNQFIRCLFTDETGVVWLGTNGGGVSKCTDNQVRFRHYKATENKGSISNNKVWGFLEDQEHNLWIGTEGGGLNLLPKNQAKNYRSGFLQFDVNPPPQQNFAFDIINISNNTTPALWVGTGFQSKLVKVNRIAGRWQVQDIPNPLERHVMTLHKDRNGAIWIGSYEGGLIKHVPSPHGGRWITYTTQNSFLPSNIIRCFMEDSKGRLWISTSEGLAVLDSIQKKSEAPEFFVYRNDPKDSVSLSNSYTVPIVESSENDIWVGTFGGGINRYIEGSAWNNGHFEHITTDDGLPNNMIKKIVEDDNGLLWISTNRGITRLNPKTGQIRNFDIYDGLQDMAFTDMSGYKRHDGEILFGGVNGFNAFYPDDITEDTIPPELAFTNLELFNNIVSVGQIINKRIILEKALNEIHSVTLKHNENDFTIHFTALHFAAPHKNQFRYKLEGYDKEWYQVNSDRRFSKYTNLKHGSYLFKFTASNSDGIWSKKHREIQINIRPPFWVTWWFRVFFLILITSLILLTFYLRTQQIRKQNIELEEEVSARTREIKEKNRVLRHQTEELNETNTILEERQQKIEEQAEELRTQRDELFDTNSLLEERTQEIESQRDQLAEVNAVKDRLFSIVAHDLKNPFTTLSGFLDVLDLKYDKYDDEKRKAMLKYALGSVKNIQTLLLNLLNWARSQSGTIKFRPEETFIEEIISANISLIQDQATSKQIKIQYQPAQIPIRIKADRDLMNTVMRNLLTNAVKFTMPNGSIQIQCSRTEEFVTIMVKDTGIGISEENKAKLFRKDTHFTTHGTDNETGTGLGLVTCKDFIELHKGTISVSSKEGIGTTFTIVLPTNANYSDETT